MSDEQIERAIELIEDLIAKRAGEHAKVIEHQDESTDVGRDEQAPSSPTISEDGDG